MTSRNCLSALVAGRQFINLQASSMMEEPKSDEGDAAETETGGVDFDIELLKVRLDLAWNWFEMHGKQRMTLFNFFLLITGILANAYAVAVTGSMDMLAISVCVVGTAQAIGFMLFDMRSRQLTRYSEAVIEKIERDILFPDGFTHELIGDGKDLGLLRRDADNRMREGQKGGLLFRAKRLMKMKYWIRLIQAIVLLTFMAGLVTHMRALGDGASAPPAEVQPAPSPVDPASSHHLV